jgi:hypothetical protein
MSFYCQAEVDNNRENAGLTFEACLALVTTQLVQVGFATNQTSFFLYSFYNQPYLYPTGEEANVNYTSYFCI